ncbi:hypothetical protein Vadar_007716 [Vaccinium darrowii]|uniref:Uncharacterized protein n=1 Tax=Vaccinium darrowii TaxID=229202 RepID=A0ACB7ZIU9_9ERIC|nr:hypothetical protein Vadar_007716 [Vaccinium darrowii]
MSGAGKVVCVTGASGYIASWIVKLLLDRGYTVKATVRSLGDPTKTDHLLSLHGAKERLQLFEANLMEEGSFDSVVDGCEGFAFEICGDAEGLTDCLNSTSKLLRSSPLTSMQLVLVSFCLSMFHPLGRMIKPAVKGTENVLCSCAKVPSIKRVVVTSSFSSVAFNNRPRNPDVVIDETWFSDPVYCEQSKAMQSADILWLQRIEDLEALGSKREGLAGAKQNCFRGSAVDTLSPLLNEAGLNFVSYIRVPISVMPSLVNLEKLAVLLLDILVGDSQILQCQIQTYVYLLAKVVPLSDNILIICYPYEARNLLDAGTGLLSDGVHRFVDVRDVALAHIQAFEVSSASGRYCLVGRVTNTTETLNILSKLYPALNLPERGENENPVRPPYQVSKKKAESLGINFTPLEVTLKDTVESFKEKNFLHF